MNNAPAVLEKFVRQSKKTFSTLSANSGHREIYLFGCNSGFVQSIRKGQEDLRHYPNRHGPVARRESGIEVSHAVCFCYPILLSAQSYQRSGKQCPGNAKGRIGFDGAPCSIPRFLVISGMKVSDRQR